MARGGPGCVGGGGGLFGWEVGWDRVGGYDQEGRAKISKFQGI